MPVTITDPPVKKYIGNASTTVFATGFEFILNATLQVEVDKVLQTETVHYAVTGGAGAVGTVTFITAPPAPAVAGTTNVILRRLEPRTQGTDFLQGGSFPSNAADLVHDRLVYIEQEQDEEFSRALVIPPNNIAGSWDGELPDPGDPALLPTTGTFVMRIQASGVTYVALLATDIAQPLTTKGAIMTYSTAPDQLLPGGDGLELNTDSAEATGLKWVTRAAPQGQCQAIGDSFGNIDLNPHDGDVVLLKVGGVWVVRHVPVAGTLTALSSGLTLNTLYYIYLWDNAGTLELESSTTAPVLDTDTRFSIKGGPDPSRLLVAAGYVTTGPNFLDNPATRHVRSWFHDPGVIGAGTLLSDVTTTSSSYVVTDSTMTMSAVTWTNELVRVDHSGAFELSAAGTLSTAISSDGTTANTEGEVVEHIIAAAINQPTIVNNWVQFDALTQGLNTFTHLVKTTAGTLLVEGTAQPGRYRGTLWTGGRP